ncbi:hypothetical protein Drorol1_Dr00017095 [Drosera rotundifolia]
MPDPKLSSPNPTPPPSSSENPTTAAESASTKWPGWPGDNVFRLIVRVVKVCGIIGRRGELVKRICDETKARIRVLKASIGTTDRVVLISGQEGPYAPLSPAMDAVLRVFRLVVYLPNAEADSGGYATGTTFFSFKLLVAFQQALSLIGRQGSTIKSFQDSSGATVRVSAERTHIWTRRSICTLISCNGCSPECVQTSSLFT